MGRASGTAGVLTFDNGGVSGGTTPLSVTNAPDVTIKGSAIGLLSGVQAVGNLVLRSNSSLQLGASGLGTLTLNVLKDAIKAKYYCEFFASELGSSENKNTKK